MVSNKHIVAFGGSAAGQYPNYLVYSTLLIAVLNWVPISNLSLYHILINLSSRRPVKTATFDILLCLKSKFYSSMESFWLGKG